MSSKTTNADNAELTKHEQTARKKFPFQWEEKSDSYRERMANHARIADEFGIMFWDSMGVVVDADGSMDQDVVDYVNQNDDVRIESIDGTGNNSVQMELVYTGGDSQ